MPLLTLPAAALAGPLLPRRIARRCPDACRVDIGVEPSPDQTYTDQQQNRCNGKTTATGYQIMTVSTGRRAE